MAWFKVCDALHSHRKMLDLRASHRCWKGAKALWLDAGSWCGEQENGGKFPAKLVRIFGYTNAEASALVSVGLWETDGDCFAFHDWDAYQPSKNRLDSKRDATRERVKQWRNKRPRNAVTNVASNAVTNGASNASPDPTRPDPTISSLRSESERRVRVAFLERFDMARGVQGSLAKDASNVAIVAAWLTGLGGDFGQHLSQLLDGFFAATFPAERGFPFGLLAKDPAQYHSPPKRQSGIAPPAKHDSYPAGIVDMDELFAAKDGAR